MKKDFQKNDFFNNDNNKWKGTLLSLNATIEDVLKNLNKTGLRISLIINEKQEFQGTVTDGDIRKALVEGVDQKTSIQKIINRNAFIVSPEIKPEIVLQLMIKNKVQQIPVVNEVKKINGLYLWDEVISQKKITNTMVIMAGGKGTRLGKYTKNCPKPLLPVNGKPMLEQIIDRAKLQGFERFIISINYLGKMIEDYFGNGEKWNVKIDYIKEDQPLGTAGSLSFLFPKPEHPFIV